MGAKLKPVRDLATYWKRERDFERRLPLIDGREMLSMDSGENDALPFLATRPKPVRSSQWEFDRIRLAASMLPKDLKPYGKVLWAIYYHRTNRHKIAKACGYTLRHYRNIFTILWQFYTERRGFFRNLTARQLGDG